MKQQQLCTDIKQSQRLIELGLREDTADLFVTKEGKGYRVSNKKSDGSTPAWSLSKLVEMVCHYPTPHPEVWSDVDFFTEIYNEVCHMLVDGYGWDYWSDTKREQEKDAQRNRWSKYAEKVKGKLPTVFQCKTPKGQELIAFYEAEGNLLAHRDDRLGRIYRHTAKVLEEYEDMKRKPKTMLQWTRNNYGYHLVSLWAINDEGKGCFEYAVDNGKTRLSAFWHLAKRLRCQGQLNLLRYIKKQERHGNGLEQYRKKYFKVKRIADNFYIVCQRHTLFFFLHFYDSGAELLCPDYRTDSKYKAPDMIDRAAREKHFDYCIKLF